jgi:deoxyribonuclease-4
MQFFPGMKTVQTFMGVPTSLDFTPITTYDKELTAAHCQETDSSLYIHCPLNANLAKPHCTRAKQVISQQLESISGLPAACVLHIGKVGTIETVAQNINSIQSSGHLKVSQSPRVPYHLLLEIAAGQGTELGRSWEEIRHLYEALDSTRVGLCVDTQHAFASGMCKFETHEDVVKLFDAASYITSGGISMIHLNDSMKAFGSQVDRHAPLRQGYIWSESDEGLRSVIKLSRDHAIDLISETKDPLNDVSIVQKYL